MSSKKKHGKHKQMLDTPAIPSPTDAALSSTNEDAGAVFSHAASPDLDASGPEASDIGAAASGWTSSSQASSSQAPSEWEPPSSWAAASDAGQMAVAPNANAYSQEASARARVYKLPWESDGSASPSIEAEPYSGTASYPETASSNVTEPYSGAASYPETASYDETEPIAGTATTSVPESYAGAATPSVPEGFVGEQASDSSQPGNEPENSPMPDGGNADVKSIATSNDHPLPYSLSRTSAKADAYLAAYRASENGNDALTGYSDGLPLSSQNGTLPSDQNGAMPSGTGDRPCTDEDETLAISPDNTEQIAQRPVSDMPAGFVTDDGLAEMGALKTLEERRAAKKRKKRKKIIIVSSIAAAAIIAGIWWSVSNAAKSTDALDVATATVERGDFTAEVSASGALEPVNSSNVTPEVDGIIEAVYVSEGATVNAGDTLFTLTNSALDKAVTEADQQVRTAQNGVDAAQVQLDGAYASYNGAYDAYVQQLQQGLDATFDEATLNNAIESAKVSLAGANITLESAQQSYNEAVATAAKRTVTAPISGSIIAMNAVAGTPVSSGASTAASSSPLIQIADISKMTVTIQVNEIDISKVSTGQTASITFSAVPGLTLSGTVQSVATSSTASSATAGTSGITTYAVKILIDAPDSRLKPGMTASAKIQTQSLENVLMVPVTAIQTADDGSTYLLVIPDATGTETGGATSSAGASSSTGSGEGISADSTAGEQRAITVVTEDSTTAVVEGDISEGDVIELPNSSSASGTTGNSTAMEG